jgi:hypothetical protein
MDEGEAVGKFCVDDDGENGRPGSSGCCRSRREKQTAMEKVQEFLDVVSFRIQRFLEGQFYR